MGSGENSPLAKAGNRWWPKSCTHDIAEPYCGLRTWST